MHSGASVTQLARVLAQLIGLTRMHAFVLAGTPVVMPARPAAIAPPALLHLQLSVVYGAPCGLRVLDWLATRLQQLPQLAHLSGRSCASEADEEDEVDSHTAMPLNDLEAFEAALMHLQ